VSAPAPAETLFAPPADLSSAYAPPSGPFYGDASSAYAPMPLAPEPRPRRTGLVLGLVAGGLALVLVAVAAVAALRSTGSSSPSAAASSSAPTDPTTTPTGTSSPASATPGPAVTSATQGVVAFSDSFASAGSGWTTESLPSGTKFSYAAGGYRVVAKGDLHHFAYAPFDQPIPRVAITAEFDTDARAAGQVGVGVSCDRRVGAESLRYEFLVFPGASWFIEEGQGSLGSGPANNLLKTGRTSVKPGAHVAVTGSCATAADGRSTELTLFVDGTRVAGLTSTTPVPASTTGWVSDLVVGSLGTAARQVTATSFVVRDTAA
jgi:hypothetical protein